MTKQTSFQTASSIARQAASSQVPRGRPKLQSMLSHQALYDQPSLAADDGDDNYEAHEAALATDIAGCISNELKTLALIAALLSSWAATVYAGEIPMDDGLCLGPAMVRASYVIFWISLGWFFLCISSILAIIADLDGVPRQFLFKHLQQQWVRVIYQVPEVSMIGGIIFLAVGYALDVGERAGCPFLIFGIVAAIGFVGSVGVLFVLLKRARQDLCGYEKAETHGHLGKSFIATWRDRMDKHTRHRSEVESDHFIRESEEEKMVSSEEYYDNGRNTANAGDDVG